MLANEKMVVYVVSSLCEHCLGLTELLLDGCHFVHGMYSPAMFCMFVSFLFGSLCSVPVFFINSIYVFLFECNASVFVMFLCKRHEYYLLV